MAIITPESVSTTGLTPTVRTPSPGGDKVPVGSRIRITNGTAGSINFTMTTHQEVDGDLAVPDRVEAIPASEVRYFLASGVYRNPTDGYVDILSSDTTAAVDLEVTV
ncbi:hypothetical protein [Glycomyces sp. NPDC021274]|uniref:hypothetical protein n=1 Tax=Glycomyces sp. NPDC021274 TaxID=3155120 RepID=UPI0033F799C0